MQDIIDAPLPVEQQKGPIQGQAQPIAALSNLDSPLDDAAVRQALAQAEANNQDPMTVTLSDMAAGQSSVPATNAPSAKTDEPSLKVPEKFLKPDGAVDVEKLQASTRQLVEAVKAKEADVTKTVDDFVREYRTLENQLRNMPNPERLAASLPSNPAPAPAQIPAPQMMDQDQLEMLINRDIQANPGRTITQLIQLALDNRFKPIEEDRKVSVVRENLQQLAAKDSRVLHPEVFKAINQKLASDPDYWKLKNPHRAAWLDVKEEMRLGDPATGQAQPSRLPAPVLGGGIPPSAPSVSAPQDVFGNLDKLDLRDRKQEAAGDEAIRALLSRSNR